MNRFLTFWILGISILLGCKKDNIPEIKLDVVYLNDLGPCFPIFSSTSSSGYVINDSKSFQTFRDSTVSKNIACDTASLPNIDFSQYTLIGITTKGTCSLHNLKEVIDDKEHLKYIYKIQVISTGSCYVLAITMNWALVPKLPSNYNVAFEILTRK